MLKKFLTIFVLLSVALLTAAENGQNRSRTARESEVYSILATVNGSAISLKDVLPLTRNQEYQAYAAFSGKRLEEEIRRIRRKAVDELIDRKLIIAAYNKQSYRIASSDIEHELDSAAVRMGCRSRNEFRRKLRENDLDIATFRKELEERMIIQFMLHRQTTIAGTPTPQEIYVYYQQHKDELSGIETYDLAMLKIDNTSIDAVQIQNEVTQTLSAAPERFAELVRRYAPGSGDGRIGSIEPGKMRIEFSTALKEPVEGKIYGPIKLDEGVAWIKLLKHNKKADVAFDLVQKKICRILEDEQRRKVIEIYTRELRRDAVLEYYF
ncbi:MAG: SurA N-terminal domain-containing protein [Lentisphaeria bacterium]|nr:SurA N-terminal domain-containing protein [Lentisphaeria bacterium]